MGKSMGEHDGGEKSALVLADSRVRRYKIAVAVLASILLAFVLAIVVIVVQSDVVTKQVSKGKCKSLYKQNTMLPKNPTVFQDLSKGEYHAVRDYMLTKSGLGIVAHAQAKQNSNYIYLIELYIPKKAEVISFLDGNGKRPIRTARVIVVNGAKITPDVEEYLVQPLPTPTSHKKLSMAGYSDPISFATRPYTILEDNEFSLILKNVSRDCYVILKESFDFWYHNCTTKCLTFFVDGIAVAPGNKERKTWAIFTRHRPGFNNLPIPFEVLFDHADKDTKKWKILQVFYNNQYFASVKELVDKYNNNAVNKTKFFLDAASAKAVTLDRRGEPFLKEPTRGPAMIDPQGNRFNVEGRKINYMGWQFHFGMRSSAGPALYDIQFNNSRIIYELSMQEAGSFYSASDPRQSTSQFLDSAFKFGSSDMELLKGVDCPENAIFMDSSHFVDTGEASKNPNSACIFEINHGIPLRRHVEFSMTNGRLSFMAGMMDHALVVRTILVPFNYDYIIDFIFYQTGIVEVKVSTSGYTVATTYYGQEASYSYESLHRVSATVHDHMLLFKADIDVAGQQNSYQTLDVVVKNVSCPWNSLGYLTKKTLQRNVKQTEKEALLKYNFDLPKYLVFFNENSTNKFGNPRGYRIQSGHFVKQKYPDDYYVTRAAAWSKYQMAVTKHKDAERYGTSVCNQYGMGSPAFDFDHYINDNDKIVNEDLVAWVTIGGLHIPNTEDVPVTATSGNRFSFFIRPFGYFDEDPSMGSTDGVIIKKNAKGIKIVETYGTPKESRCPVPDREFWYQTA